MIPAATFPIFAAAAALLIVSPGPDTIYIIARSVGQGRVAGVVSALGIFCGLMLHLTLATLGLSALVASSLVLFSVIKFVGAVYLISMGVRMLLARGEGAAFGDLPPASLSRIFRQGAVTNMLNPKVVLFFVAFLPQFVEPRLGRIPLQIFTLGMIFSIAGTLWNSLTGIMAGSLGDWLRRNPSVARVQQRFAGVVFVGLGVRMALLSKG